MTKVTSLALADIRDTTERKVEKVCLPPGLISVLTQVRKTYDIQEDLIPSFLARGQITAGMAAALTPDQAEIYVETVNGIYGSRHTVSELVPVCLDGSTYYLVLFAGHRRHLTILHINEGIERGTFLPTERYSQEYRVDLHFDISATEAIELQFHENRHSAPPLHEEASAAWRFYRFKLREKPDLTPGLFAKSIGRTPEWVRNALRFCSLPESIQAYVTGEHSLKTYMKKPALPYGILVSLARLAEGYQTVSGEELAEQAMHFWLHEALTSRMNVASFGKKVSGYLEQLRQQAEGQSSLFGDVLNAEERERRTRQVVAEEMVRFMLATFSYFKIVEGLRKNGDLGRESYLGPYSAEDCKRFSPKSPIRMCVQALEMVQGLAPHLAELSRLEKTGHFRRLRDGHPEMAAVVRGFEELALLEGPVAGRT